VQARSAPGRELLIERLADESVRETVAIDAGFAVLIVIV
jgi:hypothetical protein